MPRRGSGGNGFTFLEIIIAMLLLSGVTMAAMTVVSSSRSVVVSNKPIAYDYARQKLDEMYEFVRQDTWAINGSRLSVVGAGPQGTTLVVPGGPTLTANYTVTSADPDGNAQEDYRIVRMTVSW